MSHTVSPRPFPKLLSEIEILYYNRHLLLSNTRYMLAYQCIPEISDILSTSVHRHTHVFTYDQSSP